MSKTVYIYFDFNIKERVQGVKRSRQLVKMIVDVVDKRRRFKYLGLQKSDLKNM